MEQTTYKNAQKVSTKYSKHLQNLLQSQLKEQSKFQDNLKHNLFSSCFFLNLTEIQLLFVYPQLNDIYGLKHSVCVPAMCSWQFDTQFCNFKTLIHNYMIQLQVLRSKTTYHLYCTPNHSFSSRQILETSVNYRFHGAKYSS